jgi:hypothetical protein
MFKSRRLKLQTYSIAFILSLSLYIITAVLQKVFKSVFLQVYSWDLSISSVDLISAISTWKKR